MISCSKFELSHNRKNNVRLLPTDSGCVMMLMESKASRRYTRFARRAARESGGWNGFVPGVALADSGNRRADFFDAFSVVMMPRCTRKEVARDLRFEISDFKGGWRKNSFVSVD